MKEHSPRIQKLLSLPERLAADHSLARRLPGSPDWFVAADGHGGDLGSGGATANLLFEAWKASSKKPFLEWLSESPKLVLHGGGQSRRLPAYAPVSRSFLPVPVFRWTRGQRLDQTLLDLQTGEHERVLRCAPSHFKLMVASSNVLLRFGRDLPAFPEVDVLCLGLWVKPEIAKDFGVFFTLRNQPREIQFFLQKPSIDRIRQLNTEYFPLVDTGIWLLSERAVTLLMERCGWRNRGARPPKGFRPYDLYAQFGASLGAKPQQPDSRFAGLTTAVLPMPTAEFYPFGSSRQMIESLSRIQSFELDESKIGLMGSRQYPSQFLQNCHFAYPLRLDANHTLWIENSSIPSSWKLASEHVLTGVPENKWDLELERGVCLDFVPIAKSHLCARFYHIDDTFQGRLNSTDTQWLGQPVQRWFEKRGISLLDANIAPDTDIQDAPLFPVLDADKLDPAFLAWIFQKDPALEPRFAKAWTKLKRLSASALTCEINLEHYFATQAQNRARGIPPMLKNGRFSVFYKLDLKATAELAAQARIELPEPDAASLGALEPMQQVRDEMFRSALARLRKQPAWEEHTRRAFGIMRELIIQNTQLTGVHPLKSAYPDQIIWGRSPVRLDLAGGWSDTPPYCLENGGRVINVAVDLNGQPPIQVFARVSEIPEIVLRSIDLGLEHRIRTYAELDTYARLDSPFPFAKAAFALAGFLPAFLTPPHYRSLREQLEAFGGGIELSMLCAVPKGSGLGTSSILGNTLLSVLSDLCGLNWNLETLFIRTLALEQMCTTGGGWQDQAGGMYRGIKLVETQAGLLQRPSLQWLPEHVFSEESRNKSVLLYYTGVTRLAKNILDEIVRGIFLNSGDTLRIIGDIGANAIVAANAIQSCNYQALVESIGTSWRLNQALDSGTNPPAIQAILSTIGDYVASAKLLGAGGGGYLLIFAKDAQAGHRIRQKLADTPPNASARFVDFSISQTGLQRTRS